MTVTRPEALFSVTGVVVPGDQRGRLLGFPTANIPLAESGLADGVYAGTVHDRADGSTHVAAVSVGRRTSFYGRDGQRLLEAHLLDFSGPLYGHEITVELCAKLRPQRRYRDAEALVQQLGRDIAATRTWAREQSAEASRRRADVRPRAKRAHETSERIRREREEQRLAAIARTVTEVGPTEVTHELVAVRSRVPVAYLRWAYPSVDELLAAAASFAPRSDAPS
ncbi:Riboflavin kinase [Rathayibacter oskolensis]|uniref:riboflavin kinase n=1 Tax=Rathayibacter oskolensis TaxID=1891671 RepID=A0A1X7PF36_9MICO|nr:riboflavin kinase [Rathayibacter oskolensis]SMH49484.1 Riboflavin kinase [Rathayibacter oskolensis]